MLISTDKNTQPIHSPVRDSVDALVQSDRSPRIVSISDIHGYLEAARSALLTVADHSDYPPVVVQDTEGKLHWADENYVLVFNGDLIDRGPKNEEVLGMVSRLISEAPPGRVRVTLGNHEGIILSSDYFGFSSWYSTQVDIDSRRALLTAIIDGHVIATYQGYNVIYAHAGSPELDRPQELNDMLVDAAEELLAASGTDTDTAIQRQVLDDYDQVLGVGEAHLKGEGAGITWLDFSHLPADAPQQVVGHTRHDRPEKRGNVFCQNIIRNNLDTSGGEGVFIESPEKLCTLIRQPDGQVRQTRLLDPL